MFHGRGGRWERRLLLSGWRWRIRDLKSAESDVPASVAVCCAVLWIIASRCCRGRGAAEIAAAAA